MPACLADTHAHLADPSLLPDVATVVAAAEAAGVSRILAVGTDLATSDECVQLAERFASVYAAVGIHPHEAASFGPKTLATVRRLAAHPRVVAIGETGLDYVRSFAPPAAQRQAFREQLTLAAELGLPVVVHNRAADADVIRFMGEVARAPGTSERAGVLHCFSGSAELAAQAWRLGVRVSFAGNVTYRRSNELRAVAAVLPLEWILTETDSPYLAPEPRRGRTNVPQNVVLVARQLAEARGVSFEVIADQTTRNAHDLFGWS